MTMKTSESELRKFLNQVHEHTGLDLSSGPTMQQWIDSHPSWSQEDIQHYLRTEQDPVRLARWCELYLMLDY